MASPAPDSCDHCGSTRVVWRKCKQVCLDCGQITRSCADLAAPPPAGPDPLADAHPIRSCAQHS